MNSRQTAARGVSILLVAILTVALTACEPVLNRQVSISVNEENELLLGSCHEPMKITEVNLLIASEDDEVTDQIDGYGSVHLGDGQIITVREDSDDIDFGQFKPLDLREGTHVEVHLFESPGEVGDAAWGVFKVPEGGLRPGRWLFADGSGSDRVCGAYE